MPNNDGFNYSDKTLVSYDPEICPSNVEVPFGCTAISDGAFSGCAATSITLPDSVTQIGNELFAGCENLRQVHLPKLLKKLGSGTFRGCTLLEKIELPDSISGFEESLFEGCCSLKEIPFRTGIKTLPANVFSGCDGLISLVIPDTVESIKAFAASYCTELTTIVLPKNLKSIDDEAFTGCSALKHIRFSDDNPVFYIDEDTGCLFQQNDDETLTLIKVPAGTSELRLTKNVVSAHTEAFDGAENVETVYMDCNPDDHPLFFQLKTKLVSASLVNENEGFSSIENEEIAEPEIEIPETAAPEKESEEEPVKKASPKKKASSTRKPRAKKIKEPENVLPEGKIQEEETISPEENPSDDGEKIALTSIPSLSLPGEESEEQPKKKRKYTRKAKKAEETVVEEPVSEKEQEIEEPIIEEPEIESDETIAEEPVIEEPVSETSSAESVLPQEEKIESPDEAYARWLQQEKIQSESEEVPEEEKLPEPENTFTDETVPEPENAGSEAPLTDSSTEESSDDAYARWLNQEQEEAETAEEEQEEEDELKGITITAEELDAAMARGMLEEEEKTCVIPEGFFPEGSGMEEEPPLPSERPEPVFIKGMDSMSKAFLVLKEKDIFPEHFDADGNPFEPVKIADDGLPEELEDIKTMIVITEKISPLTNGFSSNLIRYAVNLAREKDIRKIYFFAEMSLDNDEFLFGFGKFAHYRNIIYAVEAEELSGIPKEIMSFADIADITSPEEKLENAGIKEASPKEPPFKIFIQDNQVEGLLRLAIKSRKENGID